MSVFGSNAFGSNVLASNAFGGAGAPAPASSPASTISATAHGVLSGISGYQRRDVWRKISSLEDDIMESFFRVAEKQNRQRDALESRKTSESPLHKKNRELRELRGELHRLRSKVKKAAQEEVAKFKSKIRALRRQIRKLRSVRLKAVKSPNDTNDERLGDLELENTLFSMVQAIPLPKPVIPQRTMRLVHALPWGVASALSLLVTYYIVPDDCNALKAIGYGAGIILGAVAISKAIAYT